MFTVYDNDRIGKVISKNEAKRIYGCGNTLSSFKKRDNKKSSKNDWVNSNLWTGRIDDGKLTIDNREI